MKQTILSTSELADILRVTEKTIHVWGNSWLSPARLIDQPGKLAGERALWLWIDNILRPPKEGEESATDAKRRYECARADKEELRAKREAGILVPRESAVHWATTILVELKTSLLALPRRAAKSLEGKDPRGIESELTDEIREILLRASKSVEKNESRAKKSKERLEAVRNKKRGRPKKVANADPK